MDTNYIPVTLSFTLGTYRVQVSNTGSYVIVGC